MAEEPDRLSELPDELLQHILHLAPCREAESTAVLSRRWRGLWPPPTGAVKIDIPSRNNWPSDASLRGAVEALAAAHGPVERLTIHVGNPYQLDQIVGDVLSHPASRGVQDVRIGADTPRPLWTTAGILTAGDDDGSFSWMPDRGVGVFEFSFGVVVPSAALRALHITNCYHLAPPPPASTFPCLEVLRLRRCTVSIETLQDMVVASPELAALQLEYFFLSTAVSSARPTDQAYYDWDFPPNYYESDFPQSLCCPGVTTLVLVNCCCEYEDVAIKLDVPRVQHFKYRGKISQFTLRSPLPDVRRAHLHFLADYRSGDVETSESFWNFLKNFRDTKVLKLKLEWPIDDVASLERKKIMELLVGENQSAQSNMFCIKHLEIDAPHDPESKDVGVAIGNLLQCCPGLHDLTLKLNTADQSSISVQSKAQMEFHKSIDHFRRRRDNPVVPLYGEDGKFEVSDIPGLSDRWFHFNCLQFHLKRLSLQFHMDKDNPNCIGIRLVKFFIQRGIALEEMYIDDGNMKLWEHMNCKISGYPANPQPFSEYHVLARMSQALSMNQFSSSEINGQFHHPHKLQGEQTRGAKVEALQSYHCQMNERKVLFLTSAMPHATSRAMLDDWTLTRHVTCHVR